MFARTFGAFLLGVWMMASTASAQQDSAGGVRISLDDGEALARQMMRTGQPRVAREIANALLQADPNDTSAWSLLAQAELRLGDISAAKTAGRTAWRTGTTQRERFEAAFTMADIFAADEAYSRSQIWIRRAIQTAPGPQSEQIAIDAFRRVRTTNPLAVELNFGLEPSSNVNSGNANEQINFAFLPGVFSELLWVVPPDERPLSGIEFSLQTDFRYRIASTQTSRTSLEFGLFGRTFLMSDDARETAPDVTGESLSFIQASAGVLHQWLSSNASPYSASLTYNRSWAGGAPYKWEMVGDIGTQFRFDNSDALSVSGGVRYSYNTQTDTDVVTTTMRARWSRVLENDDIVGASGQIAYATSDATDQAYTGVTIGLSYDFGDVLNGIDLRANWSEQLRTYETSAFDPVDGREDRISILKFDIGFQDVQFYGFEPVMTLQGSRTDSSVSRFDTEGVQMGINLRSSF